MALLDNTVTSQVKEFFNGLTDPVTMEFYSGSDPENAKMFLGLANEVADLSDLVMLKETDIKPALEPGHGAATDEIAGPIVELLDKDGNRTGVRYVGIPSGHEFGTLLEGIKSVSTKTSTLSQNAKDALARVTSPLHIQVFTTPT